MARRMHDDSLCPSGAGIPHYRDECDEDSENFTDPAPEPVESTCAWLVAAEEYAEEQGKQDVRERGLMVGWRDASAVEDRNDRFHEQGDAGDGKDEGRGE